MKLFKLPGLLTLVLLFVGQSAVVLADSKSRVLIPTPAQASQVNTHTVGVVFTHEELFHQLVHNLEDELEPASGLRIVPVMGKNHVQSIYDLLYLSGIDLALVRADALEYVARKGNFPSVSDLVRNVSVVSEEKIVIIANGDIQSIEELRNKDIAFGVPGSGEYVTGTITFDTIELNANALAINTDSAIDKVKSGELPALVYLLKPGDAVHAASSKKTEQLIRSLTDENVHILPINSDYRLDTIYSPAVLTHDDLPNLIGDNEKIATYSVDAILAAYNWPDGHPRLTKVSRFVDAFVENLDGLRDSHYQPSWQRVDLNRGTPIVKSSTLVTTAIQELHRIEEQKRLAEEARIAEETAAKLEKLTKQKNEVLGLLTEKIGNANAEETEKLVNELSALLSARESTTGESTRVATFSDSITMDLVLVSNHSDGLEHSHNVGSITIQPSADSPANATDLKVALNLDGLSPGKLEIAIHERPDCGDPGKQVGFLSDMTFPSDGATSSELRLSDMNIELFHNRSIIITYNSDGDAAQENRSIVCGIST